MNIFFNYPLSSAQSDLLNYYVALPFNLGKFASLDDVLTSQKVDVIVEPGTPLHLIPTALDEAEKYWAEEADRRERLIPVTKDKDAAYQDYQEARKNLDEVRDEREQLLKMPLRGLYDPAANVIKLYPEEMMREKNGTCMDELLVSTLAHEIMHAYFNRRGHKNFPYVFHVEEPLAEFGMLLYLQETGSPYYSWAHQDVSSKRTCYRYGAALMDQYQNGDRELREYLERYKIRLDGYPMPKVDAAGGISIPARHSPVQVGGTTIQPKWQDVFKYPPRWFYDKATNTLGLDGYWGDGPKSHKMLDEVDIFVRIDLRVGCSSPLSHVYLGDNFTVGEYCGLHRLLSSCEVVVSPANKKFMAKRGVPFLKKDNKPFLSSCGDGLYEICRNGKWGVIDDRLNLVVECKYDCVWSFDENGLLMVRIYDGHCQRYGLVNMQGEEQVPLVYEDISINNDGNYTVKHNSIEFVIDKDGNRK